MFYDIKRNFIISYSLVSIVCYLLGVGDRHLDNFLVDLHSGHVIALDIGYSFG